MLFTGTLAELITNYDRRVNVEFDLIESYERRRLCTIEYEGSGFYSLYDDNIFRLDDACDHPTYCRTKIYEY
jgi:hypothetical protein